MFKIPQEILDILNKIEQAGFEAYLVGGCVRDILLNSLEYSGPKDWDITTNAKPEQIQNIFKKSVYENNFGTVAVFTESNEDSLKLVEITPFRLEAKYSDKRHPDEVRFADKIEDDLLRRDFTINAMALKILNIKSQILNFSAKDHYNYKIGVKSQNYEIIDLFNGQSDLKNKIIKTVGNPNERFNEDNLRILRAIRFMSELEFEIDEKTEKEMKNLAPSIENVSKERIRDEFIKIIMSQNPDKAFYKMHSIGILKIILPEFELGFGVSQNKHHIYTVFDHNINALMHAVSKNWTISVRLASLFHDIGKPSVKRGEGQDSTFYNHETAGAKISGKILKRLKFSRKISEKVIKLIRWHLFFSDTEKITLSAVRRVVRNVGEENIWDLMKVRFSDRVGMGRPKAEPYRLRKYESMIEEALRTPLNVKMLMIKGYDIMKLAKIPPSPKVGFILNILLEEVLDDASLNNTEYLEKKVIELSVLNDEELQNAAKKAKDKNIHLDELKIREIRKKYYVE